MRFFRQSAGRNPFGNFVRILRISFSTCSSIKPDDGGSCGRSNHRRGFRRNAYCIIRNYRGIVGQELHKLECRSAILALLSASVTLDVWIRKVYRKYSGRYYLHKLP